MKWASGNCNSRDSGSNISRLAGIIIVVTSVMTT